MPADVQDALRAVLVRWGEMGGEAAEQYLALLLSTRQLQLETWT